MRGWIDSAAMQHKQGTLDAPTYRPHIRCSALPDVTLARLVDDGRKERETYRCHPRQVQAQPCCRVLLVHIASLRTTSVNYAYIHTPYVQAAFYHPQVESATAPPTYPKSIICATNNGSSYFRRSTVSRTLHGTVLSVSALSCLPMFLRIQALRRLIHATTFSAPKHRPIDHPTNQLLPSATGNCCAYRQYHLQRITAPGRHQKSSTGWTVAIVFGIAISGALFVPLVKTSLQKKTERRDSATDFSITHLTDSYLVMAPNTPPGRPGTLTPEEERKLRQLWAMTMKVFGVEVVAAEDHGADTSVAAPASDAGSEHDGKKDKKKSRLNVFKRTKDDKSVDAKPTNGATPSDISSLSLSAEDDKHGQSAEFKAAIANTPPEELRRAFWSMVKHDHPDALLLRFLRARKWDAEKALIMMISTMHWRLAEMHVDDDIVKNGELKAMEDTKSTDAKTKKHAEDFLTQLRMGKSYLHGLDNEGRPMCYVRARLHRAGEQSEESLERFTVYTIETARMLLRPPIDTAVSPPFPFSSLTSESQSNC